MNRLITILLSVVAVAGFVVIGWIILATLKSQGARNSIPVFSFPSLDGRHFGNADLSGKATTIFIYASPECEHCSEVVEELIEHRDQLASSEIVMVFPFETIAVEKFVQAHPSIGDVAHLRFVIDPFKEFPLLFGHGNFPSFYVYGREGKLKAKFEGLPDFTFLSKHLEP